MLIADSDVERLIPSSKSSCHSKSGPGPGPGPRLVVEVTVKAVTNVRGSHNLKLFQPTAAGTVVAMWSWHDFTASGESLARFKLAAGGASRG